MRNAALAALLLLAPLAARSQEAALPADLKSPADVLVLGRLSSGHAWGVTNNYNADAAVERELHDGQFLAGGKKAFAYLLRTDARGNLVKAAHIGMAVMQNAQHGNTSIQAIVGIETGSLGQILNNVTERAAPRLNQWGKQLPPWTGKLGYLVTLDFAAGYRPYHDASVNGQFTYGILAGVSVPIEDAFGWLASGL